MSAGVDSIIEQSRSWDGYVREAAVRELGRSGDERAIPELLIRANDWVEEVRLAARQALEFYLTPAYAAVWVASLPAVYHLGTCKRADHGALTSSVESLLVQPSCRPAMDAGLYADSAAVVRAVLRLFMRYRLRPWGALLDDALESDDVVLKREVLRWIQSENSVDPEFILQCLRDHYCPLRRAALQRLAHDCPHDAGPIIEGALTDRSGGVRDMAQTCYRERGGDPRAFYLGVLQASGLRGHRIRRALLGLASVGQAADADRIRPFLGDGDMPVRNAAFRALVRVDDGGRRDTLVEGLTVESGVSFRLAIRLSKRHRLSLRFDELGRLLGPETRGTSGGPARWDVDRLIRIARRGNKWDQLYYLTLPLSEHAQKRGKVHLHTRIALFWELQRWIARFNRSHLPPTMPQQERLRAPLENARSIVDGGLYDTIFWHVYGTHPEPEGRRVLWWTFGLDAVRRWLGRLS